MKWGRRWCDYSEELTPELLGVLIRIAATPAPERMESCDTMATVQENSHCLCWGIKGSAVSQGLADNARSYRDPHRMGRALSVYPLSIELGSHHAPADAFSMGNSRANERPRFIYWSPLSRKGNGPFCSYSSHHGLNHSDLVFKLKPTITIVIKNYFTPLCPGPFKKESFAERTNNFVMQIRMRKGLSRVT